MRHHLAIALLVAAWLLGLRAGAARVAIEPRWR